MIGHEISSFKKISQKDQKLMRIGMGQLLVEGGEADRNIRRAEEMIDSASKQGCDLVLLPETLDLGWTHPSAIEEAEVIPGPRSRKFCESAKDKKIFVCCGLTERHGDKIYNTAILINRIGEIILKYRKINLLKVEQPFYEVGRSLGVVGTEFGMLGLNICSDNYKDGLVLGHSLARMGAQIVLSPSSWTVDYVASEKDDPYEDKWIRPYSHLADLYNLIVIGTTSVGYIVGGPYEGKKSVGCSLAVGNKTRLAQGKFNEIASELIVFDAVVPERREKGTEIGEKLLRMGELNYGF